jgi:2-C-methyl-D-erythritol 4-phosphate cytidylyltransferase
LKKYAIIVAAGHGMRMGNETPKQFLPLNGKPLLFHSIEKFEGIAEEIIVVLPPGYISKWERLCADLGFNIAHTVIEGGSTRTLSVVNGLSKLNGKGIVAIHDAARPLVSKELIKKVYAGAVQYGSAIPVVPVKESIRIAENGKTRPVDRDNYLLVQTPQAFQLDKIQKAYTLTKGVAYTDDASVLEAAGEAIHTVEGESTNLKITYREDMFIAEKLLDYHKM